jgi:hypothetical protein
MPAPNNPFPTIANDLAQESLDVLAAFSNAETELVGQGAQPATFLELAFDGTYINRIFDNAQVLTLSDSEQLRLYPQLFGLFNLAMRNKLYP